MLPRSQRLNAREFAVVFENSQVLRHPLLQLRLYKRRGAGKSSRESLKQSVGETRAAFVAPRKLGNAVVRNAIRRRVRERYRVLRAEALRTHKWHATLENCDLVFLAAAPCREATIEQIDESLSHLLKRAAHKAAESRQEVENRGPSVG